MKILYIATGNKIGGSEISLIEMINLLSDQTSYELHLALPIDTDLGFWQRSVRESVKIHQWKIFRWNIPKDSSFFKNAFLIIRRIYKTGWPFSLVKLYRIIKRHQIDIVHTNNTLTLDGALAAKFSGAKHVLHLRELFGKAPSAIVNYPFVNIGLGKYIFRKLNDKIIANSNYLRNAMSWIIPVNRSKVIYNVVNVEEPVAALPKNAITVGLMANFESAFKNHRLYVDFVALYKAKYPGDAIHFDMYGTFVETSGYYRDIKAAIENAGLSDAISIKGFASRAIIFSTIDVLFHSYKYESFGRTVAEALLNKKLVIAVRGGGATEIIEQTPDQQFLFDEGDLDPAIEYLHAICENISGFDEQIGRASSAIKKCFSAEHQLAELKECYND